MLIDAAMTPPRQEEGREARLAEIERALKLDPDPAYRRVLIREYLDLTEPELVEPEL